MGAEEEFPQTDSSPPPRALTVVGIGASAGGLSALKSLISTIPRDSGIAYVIVVHLAPDHESHLSDLLQPGSLIPVTQPTHDVPLAPDCIYIIPPGRNISAIDRQLQLSPLEAERRDRAPIDSFLRTLAATWDGHSVGVILSGTGSDGSQGVHAIRECGGLAIVQHPEEAEFDGMPQRAIETGDVDLILPVAAIVPAILDFVRTRSGALALSSDEPQEVQSKIDSVLKLIKLRTGHDFSRYKRSSTTRRLARRMQILGVENIDDYLEALRNGPEEVSSLLNDLLINVTSFFRDGNVFDILAHDVIPRLFDDKGRDDLVRVWSVGCASGEEPYSLAMLLDEEASRREIETGFQVFASDVHDHSLVTAREAVYGASVADQVTPERLERYFRPDGSGYRVVKSLRERIVFARHNILADAPFSRMDLVVCRNLLIYLTRGVQRDAIEIFHYALRPDGFLLLGTAETVEHSERFRQSDPVQHIYQRRVAANGARFAPRIVPAGPLRESASFPPRPEASFGSMHSQLVERFAPPSLLVNSEGDVVHMSENAGRYLVQPGGAPTTNLSRMLRKELRMELRTILLTRAPGGPPRASRAIPLSLDGASRHVVMRAHAGDLHGEGLVLVTFDEFEMPDQGTPSSSPESASVEREEALALAEVRLHELAESYDATQRSTRAANEELQSSNEELRSTMEELETSREELQSLNEELQTVNQENRHKVAELSQLSGDLQNLLQATSIATIFLDRNLRIVRFTPTVRTIFNIRTSDRGRPLSDLTHKLGYQGLHEDAARVMNTLVPAESEVETTDGVWHLMRIIPYRTTDDRIDGVVITMVDVSGLKRTEAALRESEGRFRVIADAAPLVIWVHDDEGNLLFANNHFMQFHALRADDLTGDAWTRRLDPAERTDFLATYLAALEGRRPFSAVARQQRADGEWRWIESTGTPRFDALGKFLGLSGTDVDVTQARQREIFSRLLDDFDRESGPFADPVAIMNAAVKRLGEHFGASNIAFLHLESTPEAGNVGVRAQPANRRLVAGEPIPPGWRERLVKGEVVRDTAGPVPRSPGALAPQEVVTVPMLDEGTLVAVLRIETPHTTRLSADDVALLRDLCAFYLARFQRARAQQALRRSEEEYRMMVDEARDYAIFTLDEAGTVTSWSPGAASIFQFDAAEIVGEPFEKTFLAEDVAAGVPGRELQAATTEHVASDVRWHRRKSGAPVFIDGSTRALRDASGQLTGFLKVGQDVTERHRVDEALRESEARYRALVDNVHDHAIFLVTNDGIISEWTCSAERVFGHEAGDVIGTPLSDLCADAGDVAALAAAFASAASAGRGECEGWRVRKNGTRFEASCIVTTLPPMRRGPSGCTIIVRDLTQPRLLEEAATRARADVQRNDLRRKLLEVEEAERGRLSRDLHDEAGQHLTVLGLGLQALGEIAAPGSEMDVRIRTLRQAADTLGRDLHAVAVRLRPRALDDFGLEAVTVLAEVWSARTGIAADVHIPENAVRLPSDVESAVYRIVQEALTNIARHSGASRASVFVERRESELIVIVEDDGEGFAPSTTEAVGLGIAGIRERAALLGGAALIEGSAGTGVTVSVRLPFAPGPA